MDLVPPLDGHFHRANIAVPISRPSGLDDVHPLLLWSNEAGQARVLMAYIKALAPNPDRVADKWTFSTHILPRSLQESPHEERRQQHGQWRGRSPLQGVNGSNVVAGRPPGHASFLNPYF